MPALSTLACAGPVPLPPPPSLPQGLLVCISASLDLSRTLHPDMLTHTRASRTLREAVPEAQPEGGAAASTRGAARGSKRRVGAGMMRAPIAAKRGCSSGGGSSGVALQQQQRPPGRGRKRAAIEAEDEKDEQEKEEAGVEQAQQADEEEEGREKEGAVQAAPLGPAAARLRSRVLAGAGKST